MKYISTLILLFFILQTNFAQSEINKIFSSITNNQILKYNSNSKGCLTISLKEINQSYSDGCVKPINFTVSSIKLNNNRIDISLVMHFYGDQNLVGFIEIKDDLLVLSYGKSNNSQQQIDKYKLN